MRDESLERMKEISAAVASETKEKITDGIGNIKLTVKKFTPKMHRRTTSAPTDKRIKDFNTNK